MFGSGITRLKEYDNIIKILLFLLISKKSFNFALFKKVWIEPIFNEFPKLAIYESVYDELVGMELRNYVENLRQENPPKIIIHFDSELTEIERIC